MHNSSFSSAPSSTDSWDFDPDLITLDGPLTPLQSDSKNNTEDSSDEDEEQGEETAREVEDDIDKGFFDDIEFPSKFGIPNIFHQTSTPFNPLSSLPSSKLHKPTESVHSLSSDS
ncbi:hypothetical protein PPACK8108_LOCUS5105 [Phakopsora pachyrhizi]|uniref:Uncharacterized protein n=1 Tax=Phakopsora pachyrhizi TaxID=170000 RepID=A0AAV0ANE6_PHAPC|nr:hypothetical protein PPACK8108_LOCUS5105 [Phakopsora pachyrhizi]